jgi:hypothetical protein
VLLLVNASSSFASTSYLMSQDLRSSQLKTLWMVSDMAPNRGVSSTHSGTLANGSEHLGAMGRVPSGLDPSTEHHRATESVRASNGVKGPPSC